MQVVSAIVVTIGTVLTTLVVAATARRVLGAPVGWVRSAVVSLLAVTVGSWALTQAFAPLELVGDDGERLVVPVVVALVVVVVGWAWVFVGALAVLLLLELLVPTGAVPTPWAAARGLARGRRETRRSLEITRIVVRHGLGGFVRRGRRRARPAGQEQREVARALRAALADAGVTFVKLGQVLSTRQDVLPPVFVAELATLQDRVPPAPWDDVRAAAEAELGRPLDAVFAHVDPEPLASASVGQVHAATLPDGTAVVLKVQRPGARRQVELDLEILDRLGRRLERDTGWGRSVGVRDLVDGFAASLREELDYTVEAANARAVAGVLAAHDPPLLTVPRVHEDLSGPTLLVMDRVDGDVLGRAAGRLAALDPGTRRDLAERLLAATLEQVVVAGVFHADLHPGNVVLTADDGLALLDLGSVGRLAETERTAIGAVLLGVEDGDAITVTDALLELLDAPDGLDTRRLERAVGQVVVRYRSGGSTGALFVALLRLVADAGLRVPPQAAAAFRTVAALEGTLRLVDPTLDLVTAARTQGGPLLRRAVTLDGAVRRVRDRVLGLAPAVERLPRRVTRIVEDLENGRFTVSVRSLADPQDRAFLSGLVQQVITALLAAALVVGSVLLLVARGGPMLTPQLPLYAVLGAALAVVGAVLAIRVLLFAFRGQEQRR